MKEIAIFGGGCFWCTEAIFKMMRGVVLVKPGYAGGNVANPTYEQVCSGRTGHAEVVYIEYDPLKVRYRDLLTVFFGSHDPTTRDRQGNDVGSQYRSIVFTTSPEQKTEVENMIKEINASTSGGSTVVTEIVPLNVISGNASDTMLAPGQYYDAENYHRDYFANHPDNPYCEVIINPKLEDVQKRFAALLKDIDDTKSVPVKGDEQLRRKLTKEQYAVLVEKGTEAPWSGKLLHETRKGTYDCAACGNALFDSDAKFDSGTGWPSFDQAIPGSVREINDKSLGMDRVEIVCSKCGSHLGHVFDDGPTKTGKRYCLNSVCLELDPKAAEGSSPDPVKD